ncbi:MAG: 4Fe-4S dicluster domain-containing protein [Chloroflexi bacterium]|nr:4Fe-4S dicluster domain-containing protein [Chloroflexota bacterium]
MTERTAQHSAAVTRRRFLKALAAAGAGGALGGTIVAERAAAEAPAGGKEAARQWAFVVDMRKCDGCEKCRKSCQKTHYLSVDQKWINVYQMATTTGQKYFMPRLCMHCENAPCLRVCPVGATFKNGEGVVLVDQSICIGCRTCMAACPYEARYFNWSEPPEAPAGIQQAMPEFPVPQKKGTVGKCILCVHNTEMGKLPACVEACTMEALYIGDLKADVATNGRETVKLSKFLRENDAIRFREDLGTRPRVWYILGHGQKLDF